MIHELIYTSAERGLKPGSYGFCTVAATRDLPKELSDRLELMSGYRHPFGPESGKSALNPVAWSHRTLTLGGTIYHVLSRVADCDADYTKRSNKLAHHLAFLTSEAPQAGPAALLSHDELMLYKWNGQPRYLTARNGLPRISSSPSVCRRWRDLTGDAGWGGVLAETAGDPNSTVSIIYPPGTDVLALIAESLQLLPTHRQWRVTFSTYFTKLEPGTTCQWRCLLDGTAEAAAARRAGSHFTIDLCRDLGEVENSQLVESARTGIAPRKTELVLDSAKAPRISNPLQSAKDYRQTIPREIDLPPDTRATTLAKNVRCEPRAELPPKLRPPRLPSHRSRNGRRQLLMVSFVITLCFIGAFFYVQRSLTSVATVPLHVSPRDSTAGTDFGAQPTAEGTPSNMIRKHGRPRTTDAHIDDQERIGPFNESPGETEDGTDFGAQLSSDDTSSIMDLENGVPRNADSHDDGQEGRESSSSAADVATTEEPNYGAVLVSHNDLTPTDVTLLMLDDYTGTGKLVRFQRETKAGDVICFQRVPEPGDDEPKVATTITLADGRIYCKPAELADRTKRHCNLEVKKKGASKTYVLYEPPWVPKTIHFAHGSGELQLAETDLAFYHETLDIDIDPADQKEADIIKWVLGSPKRDDDGISVPLLSLKHDYDKAKKEESFENLRTLDSGRLGDDLDTIRQAKQLLQIKDDIDIREIKDEFKLIKAMVAGTKSIDVNVIGSVIAKLDDNILRDDIQIQLRLRSDKWKPLHSALEHIDASVSDLRRFFEHLTDAVDNTELLIQIFAKNTLFEKRKPLARLKLTVSAIAPNL